MLPHHEIIHTGNFQRKGILMLYHLAGATVQVANLIISANPQEDGNERLKQESP